MTVSSATSRKTFAGDGATTSFATSPMIFFDTSDLVVYLVLDSTGAATTLVENTNYTVSGGDGSTGTVSLAGGSSPTGAPAVGYTLVITRDVAITQVTDLLNNDNSDADVVETALDKLTVIAQRLDDRADRTLRQPDTDEDDISALPVKATRASKYLAFDTDGNPTATSGTTSTLVASAFMETVLDDTTAAAARLTLGATGDGILSRVITPTALSGNTDNWAPTGHATADYWRISASAKYHLTGIAGGTAGRVIVLHNVGSFDIPLWHDTTSTAANRFTSATLFTLVPGQSCTLQYDGTSSRWRIIGVGFNFYNYVQHAYTSNANLSSTTIGLDDSIPQITEGTEINTLSFTPRSVNSHVRLRWSGQWVHDTALGYLIVALFDGNADAIAARVFRAPPTTAGIQQCAELEHIYAPSLDSAITFSIRVGTNAGNVRFNGSEAARLMGGASAARLIAEELVR